MLSLRNVTLRRGPRLLFEAATLQARSGERLGLIGANGSGKSSLFALLLGELEADAGQVALAPGTRIAHVAQESPTGPRTALDHVLDGDGELRAIQHEIRIREGADDSAAMHHLYERLEQIGAYAAEARAARLLAGLGFSEADLQRPVGEFSGGWRMRLNLAQALMCRSDLLLLDEPTNHLDLPAILWLEEWLRRYPGLLVLISHDRDFLDALSTRIAHIEHGQLRLYSGNYSEFENQRAAQLALQQSLYRRQQQEIHHIQTYIERFRYKASKARQAQSRLKTLERMQRIAPAHVDSPFVFRFLASPRQPQHLATLDAADLGYSQAVLAGVELQVSAGDRLGLLGANGAGKSTLVKALADGSTVLAGHRSLSQETRVGYFAQHQLDQLEPDGTPLGHLQALEPDSREADLRRYLGGFGFGGERIFDPVAPFSGGEKARLALALMIRHRPNLLLLDEPTNHLDLEMRIALARALVDFDGAIVVISHDRHLLRQVCDELLLVHAGRLSRFAGDLDDYPDWLAEQQALRAGRTIDAAPAAPKPGNRKRQRQQEAQRRLALKPLADRVRQVERELDRARARLAAVEERLADGTLYADTTRRDELAALLREQGALKAGLESLEQQWLDASESLERAGDDALSDGAV